MNKNNPAPEHSELGKKAEYNPHYNPDKLFPIPRKSKRDEIGVPDHLPFFGFGLWNHYKGKMYILGWVRTCSSQTAIHLT